MGRAFRSGANIIIKWGCFALLQRRGRAITKWGSTLSTLYRTTRKFVPSVIIVTMDGSFIVSSKQALFEEESSIKP